MSWQALQYIEIDIPYCVLSYGVAPCTAAIGVTGDAKCFNAKATCQDTANFNPADVTLRFVVPSAGHPRDIDALPYLKSLEFTPATIAPGENLGTRATLKVTFSDHKHADAGAGFDKYHATRGYDPYERGSFWPRFRARHPSLRGRALRTLNGFVGDALVDMETRHFYIESFEGPAPDGTFTIVAKDGLKFLDGDRAVAPALSSGFLVADITAVATTFTLSPAGIGNTEYPVSGIGCIGGKEVVSFTRSADAITMVRARYNTVATTHKAQDRFQLCLELIEQDPADIIFVLVRDYTDLPAVQVIPLTQWRIETQAHLNRVYSGLIVEPTSVKKLVDELIEQCGLVVWYDDLAKALRLQVLRAITTDADTFSEANVLKGTFAFTDQPDKRVSRVIVYFGQVDPTKRVDDKDNYRSSAEAVDEDAEVDWGGVSLRTIFARWIPQFGRTNADRLGEIVLGRYLNAPRKFAYQVLRTSVDRPELGGGYQLNHRALQDASGALADVPIQVTRLKPDPARWHVDAEEMRFDAPPEDPDTRAIIFDFDANNVNARTIFESLYGEPAADVTVNISILTGVSIGSLSTALPALDIGEWPAGVTINVENNGTVQGKGGRGADGAAPLNQPGNPGEAGGTALKTTRPINLTNADGSILGGGGGGGGGASGSAGSGGGGGAGNAPGLGGNPGGLGANPGAPGTDTDGGLGGAAPSGGGLSGGAGGDGGDPGQPGNPGSAHAPPFRAGGSLGAAGNAIDGNSHVTFVGDDGDIRGPQIN